MKPTTVLVLGLIVLAGLLVGGAYVAARQTVEPPVHALADAIWGPPLTLEPGCHDYVFRKGFRRAKHAPRWGLLSYFWLSATASGNGNSLKFRLKRVVMQQEPAERQPPMSEVPDLFGKRLFNPRLKHIRWGEGEFPARQH